LYFGNVYSRYCVYRCYENPAHRTLRFQVHTFFGSPGKSYEVPIGNAKIIDIRQSDAVGVRVEGLGKNLVFADAKNFNLNERLTELFNTSPAEVSKAKSIAWRKRPRK
jgi:hypothetical protein